MCFTILLLLGFLPIAPAIDLWDINPTQTKVGSGYQGLIGNTQHQFAIAHQGTTGSLVETIGGQFDNQFVYKDEHLAHAMFVESPNNHNEDKHAIPRTRRTGTHADDNGTSENNETRQYSKLWFNFQSDGPAAMSAYMISPPYLARLHTHPLNQQKYANKVRHEVNKFFIHAKKWIHKRKPGNSSTNTFHFTYSFTFDEGITRHVQAWIKWLYYVLRQLEASWENLGSGGGSSETSGALVPEYHLDFSGTNGFWTEDLWKLESSTWGMLGDLTTGSWEWGSVTLTESFGDLDNIAIGPWPGLYYENMGPFANVTTNTDQNNWGGVDGTAFENGKDFDAWFALNEPNVGYRWKTLEMTNPSNGNMTANAWNADAPTATNGGFVT